MMRGASRAFRSARLTWQRLLKDERGSVLAFFVAIPVVAGTVAVGVETGQLYRTKRQMQGAADAAALAGTIDKMNGGTNTSATAAALYEAQRNGFQNGVGGVTVTVNAPPTSGSQRLDRERRRGDRHQAEQVRPGQRAEQRARQLLLHDLALGGGAEQRDRRRTTHDHDTSASSLDGCLVALTTAAEQGVSFTNFNNFTSDCVIYSNGTSTGTTSSTASVYMASFNHATMKSVYTRGSFDRHGLQSASISTTPAAAEPVDRDRRPLCQPADAVAGDLQPNQLQQVEHELAHAVARHLLRRPGGIEHQQRLLHARHLLRRQRRPLHHQREQRHLPDLHDQQRRCHRADPDDGQQFRHRRCAHLVGQQHLAECLGGQPDVAAALCRRAVLPGPAGRRTAPCRRPRRSSPSARSTP